MLASLGYDFWRTKDTNDISKCLKIPVVNLWEVLRAVIFTPPNNAFVPQASKDVSLLNEFILHANKEDIIE